MIYEYKTRIRYADIDKDGFLSFLGALSMFQDTAVFHGEDSGATIEKMLAEDITWVLGGWQVRFLDKVKLGESVVSKTWAYKFRSFIGYRNFSIETEDGRKIAEADSQYVLINIKTNVPEKITDELAAAYTIEPGSELKNIGKGRKINPAEDAVRYDSIEVAEYMIDTNKHVNNLQYITIGYGLLKEFEDFSFDQFRAEFKKQAYLGDCFYPFVAKVENGYQVKLCDKEGEIYFIGEWTSKE